MSAPLIILLVLNVLAAVVSLAAPISMTLRDKAEAKRKQAEEKARGEQ